MADVATISALTEALEDEYRARATYRAVIEAFGQVRPRMSPVLTGFKRSRSHADDRRAFAGRAGRVVPLVDPSADGQNDGG